MLPAPSNIIKHMNDLPIVNNIQTTVVDQVTFQVHHSAHHTIKDLRFVHAYLDGDRYSSDNQKGSTWQKWVKDEFNAHMFQPV